jgi:hypothetical protein
MWDGISRSPAVSLPLNIPAFAAGSEQGIGSVEDGDAAGKKQTLNPLYRYGWMETHRCRRAA